MKKVLSILFFIFISLNGFSQFFLQKTGSKLQKGITKYEGYFTFYYDDNSDKIFLQINQTDTDFLYVRSLSEGIGSNDIGLDRGQLGAGVVVHFKKTGNKIMLIQPNQNYRAITENRAEKKSVKQAFAKSVLHGFSKQQTRQLQFRQE
jgi:hypothetical protein